MVAERVEHQGFFWCISGKAFPVDFVKVGQNGTCIGSAFCTGGTILSSRECLGKLSSVIAVPGILTSIVSVHYSIAFENTRSIG